MLMAILMTLATKVGADTTQEKLDLILEKLANIETTYPKTIRNK